MIVIVLPDIATEDRLLARARRGNQEAVMQIYEDYFSPVYHYIRLRVGDTSLAEDLTSEVFIKFIQALRGRNAPQHSLRGWLFRVARNAIYDHYGEVRQFPTQTLEEWLPEPADNSPEVHFVRSASRTAVHNALRMLAAEQQEVLILRFDQMLSLKETADIMGKSVSAIKSLQFRALDTMRGILDRSQAESYHV